MSDQIDFTIMELLTSKVCHDLISPIGAVNNGMEFVNEMGAEAGEEVFELIDFSANQASAKLQAYRMAYGAGGSDTSIKPEDVYNSIEKMISAEKKMVQEWDPHAPIGPEERPEAFAKILMLTFLLAMDCLPKGGTLKAEAGDGDEVIISATGPDAGLREDIPQCLDMSFSKDALQPKHVHAYITALTAKRYNYAVEIKDSGDGAVRFSISPPPSE